METLHHQKPEREKKSMEKKAEVKEHNQSPSKPPSASSSPSHEFSFTISLHSSSTTQLPHNNKAKTTTSSTSPSSLAIDLSPADDIFFHGHLLPLHLLSHLPVSPRSSANSLDSFTLPIKHDQNRPNQETNNKFINHDQNNTNGDDQTRASNSKSKSFSLFGLTKWRKGYEFREREEQQEKRKRKMRFDVSHVFKRYMRMVRPLLFFRGRRENGQFRGQAYSYSGNLTPRSNKQDLRGRRGEFSAPASMRTSPTNSGLLVATSPLPSSTSDSTMEELQAAIQAAIAHCKNSIASTDDKLKC